MWGVCVWKTKRGHTVGFLLLIELSPSIGLIKSGQKLFGVAVFPSYILKQPRKSAWNTAQFTLETSVSLRSQRLLGAVQKNATRGNPHSVLNAIDQFCRHTEWAMNVGDEKGADVMWQWLCVFTFLTWLHPTSPFKTHPLLWCVCVRQDVSWTRWCQRSTQPLCWSWEPTVATPRWGLLGCFHLTPSSSLWNSTPTLLPSLARSSPGREWKKR